MSKDLGLRFEFHSHTIFSDGQLLPLALALEAEHKEHAVIALTDHVDPSNLVITVKSLVRFCQEITGKTKIKILPGAEISYLPPDQIEKYAKQARKLGTKIIIVHGESVAEPAVPKGTNHAALQLKGLVDILAHPGMITEADVQLARENNIFLELSARHGHREGNKHVAALAKKIGAKMLVNTDAHNEKDLITQEQALQIALTAGLSEAEAIKIIRKNPLELLAAIK
ncbi:MAG: histidinol phosphate phosphatase domain-containing protein [bacterium]